MATNNVVVNVNGNEQSHAGQIVGIIAGLLTYFGAGNGFMAFMQSGKYPTAHVKEEVKIRGEIAREQAEHEAMETVLQARIEAVKADKLITDKLREETVEKIKKELLAETCRWFDRREQLTKKLAEAIAKGK